MTDLEKKIIENSNSYSIDDFYAKLKTLPLNIGLKVYRGDNRDINTLKQEGFSPKGVMPIENLRKFIVDYTLGGKQLRVDFMHWCKYPPTRSAEFRDKYPFVATGTEDAHYGNNEYLVDLKDFKMYEVANGLLLNKIGFNGDKLENSSIIAIQIDKHEVVFGTNIPAKFIELKK